MQHRDPPPAPGERARRRSLFSGRTEPATPARSGLTPAAAERAEVVITAYQEMIQEQLDEGLRAIQHNANTLMHEIAAEVWRGAGGDKEAVGSTILHELSRDQAIRALISHADERFQSLAARTGRLEDTMNMLAETVRGAREQLERGVDALADSPGSSLGLERIRSQLDEMTRHLGAAFQALADRDEAIVGTVQERIREHGDLIARETARISQAMESYVQQGVVAMGNLAGETDSEIKSISQRQQDLAERFEQTVETQVAQLGEQVQAIVEGERELTERVERAIEIPITQLGEQVQAIVEGERELTERVERAIEIPITQLGEQVQAIVEGERELTERVERAIEVPIGQLGEQVQAIVEGERELTERVERAIDVPIAQLGEQVQAIVEGERELTERVERAIEIPITQLGEQVQAIVEGERELTERVEKVVEDGLGRLGEQVQAIVEGERELTERVGRAIDVPIAQLGEQVQAIVAREQQLAADLDRTIEDRMGQLGEQMQLLYDRSAIAASTLNELVAGFGDRVSADTRAAVAALITTIEERVSGLAQLVRSDSEALRGEFVRGTADMDERFARRLDEDLGHAMDRTLSAIDRNMIRMIDALDGHFERLGAGVGDRAAHAAELAIGARFDDVLARLHGSADVIEHSASEARTELAAQFSVFDDRFASLDDRIASLDERLTSFDERFAGTDHRFAALAKLVRSDSERIAEQILADQDVTKQALRAMKELQASLPVEVVQMVEERFASLAESIERSNEMLAGRIDRMAETIGQRQNDDIQVVIDRMGDAMHALASLGKGDSSSSDPRIELG